MEGQLSIFDIPEWNQQDDFNTMTNERAAELVGMKIGAKFKLDERFEKGCQIAKKGKFIIEIYFGMNFEEKRILHTSVDYGTSCFGTPANSIDDCVDSILRYMKRQKESL